VVNRIFMLDDLSNLQGLGESMIGEDVPEALPEI
jgi:bacterioferritin (cytochrome b1)